MSQLFFEILFNVDTYQPHNNYLTIHTNAPVKTFSYIIIINPLLCIFLLARVSSQNKRSWATAHHDGQVRVRAYLPLRTLWWCLKRTSFLTVFFFTIDLKVSTNAFSSDKSDLTLNLILLFCLFRMEVWNNHSNWAPSKQLIGRTTCSKQIFYVQM